MGKHRLNLIRMSIRNILIIEALTGKKIHCAAPGQQSLAPISRAMAGPLGASTDLV
jgi:hypothetical protein